MEFSKKLLIWSWTVTVILTIVGIKFPLDELPADMMIVILPLSWAETAAATGFYYWKSKTENRAKYAQKFVLDFADKYGVDAAVRLAEVVLRD